MARDENSDDLLELVADDDGEPDDAGRRRWSGVVWGLAALVVVAALVVLGSRAVSPHGRTGSAAPGPTAEAAPTSTAPAPATPTGTPSAAPDGPVVLQAPVSSGGSPYGELTVGVGTPVTGRTPGRLLDFSSCQADTSRVEYLPVQIRTPPPGLDAQVTVERGPATPADTGRLGFFFVSNSGILPPPCADAATWPAADRFEAVNGIGTVPGYVVVERPRSPRAGAPDVLSTLRLRVSGARVIDGYGVFQPLTLGTPTTGSPCPGSPAAVCAPLG